MYRTLAKQAKADHTARIRDRRGESPSDAASDRARIERAIAQHDAQLHGGKRTRLELKDGGCAEGSANAVRLDRPGRKRGGMARARDAGGNVDMDKLPPPVRMPTTDSGQKMAPMPMVKGQETGDKMDAETLSRGRMMRARGGMSPLGMGKKKSGKSGKGAQVNVIVASGGGEKERPVPVPVPAAGAPPPRPPMPPPGAAGPGAPPMPPPMAGGPPPGLPPRPPMPGMMRADGGKTVAFKMKAGAGSGMGRLAKAKMPIPDEEAAPVD